jgi:two-component sensor histidine kinase
MPDREQMVTRQRVLADFGEFVLRCEDLDTVLGEACHLVGEALGTDLAKILEIDHEKQELLVRAGVGWRPGIVGRMRLKLSEQSSEAYSIDQGGPVITRDIRHENRFDVPAFMREHGIVALVNVPIFVPGRRAYGLLQVDSREPRDFGDEDTEFLRTYATILGPVIDRLHKVSDLRAALDANQRLLQELQHRTKNHISIITALVRMRIREVASEETRGELTAIGERIETLRLVNEQLYVAGSTDRLRLRPFAMQLVENLVHLHRHQSGGVKIDFAIEDVEFTPEVVVPLGLILNEFITNSLKYAFDGLGGTICVRVETLKGGVIRIHLADDGKGLPAAPHPPAPGFGTGMRLIDGLARQIGAKPVWSSSPGGGTALRLEFARH